MGSGVERFEKIAKPQETGQSTAACHGIGFGNPFFWAIRQPYLSPAAPDMSSLTLWDSEAGDSTTTHGGFTTTGSGQIWICLLGRLLWTIMKPHHLGDLVWML